MKYLKYIICFLISNYTIKSQVFTEYELKSAYLINFLKFIEFPSYSAQAMSDTFFIGIYNGDEFYNALLEISKNRTINNKQLKIVNITNITEERLKKYHIIFIAYENKNKLLQIIETFSNSHTLIIGNNIKNFCELGGTINFTPQYSTKRFEINITSAQKKGIIISSKLLKLAKIIEENEIKF
ncbi:MAG: YfiR family protein [Bacteroidales bacterium]|nr:YfiR family protein [Bacteroidales bacterium]